jgi:hypothetical protein
LAEKHILGERLKQKLSEGPILQESTTGFWVFTLKPKQGYIDDIELNENLTITKIHVENGEIKMVRPRTHGFFKFSLKTTPHKWVLNVV